MIILICYLQQIENIEIKDFFSFMLIILVFMCMTGFFEGLVSVFPFIRNT